jgi:hypothetical protein
MLALLDTDRIDRRLVERLFDLRNTAAKDLLRRMGAQLVGNSFVISRGLQMARLREAAEHPQWSFEKSTVARGPACGLRRCAASTYRVGICLPLGIAA